MNLADRLSCADSAFPKLTHEGALAVIRDLGIPAVDVCVFAHGGHTVPASVIERPRRTADAVRQRLDGCGLRVADVFAILSNPLDALAVNHPDPNVRVESLRQFRRMIEFARRLGGAALTVLPGFAFEGVDADDSLALAATELQLRAEIAREAGLGLSIEPHYGSVVQTPTRALELLARAPDVGLTLDYSHFVYQGIPQTDVDALIPRTRHLHLRQARTGVIQTRVAEGTIDFESILAQLTASRFTGYFGLEYQWNQWPEFNGVDCISETALLRDVVLAWSRER